MLENLNLVDWAGLTHAYGAATDVPGLLRALATGDSAQREDAQHQFFGNIWHQGTVYEATFYAVPFFIELLQEPKVAGKDYILRLLAAIANGRSYLHVHGGMDCYHDQRDTPAFNETLAKELSDVQSCLAAVQRGAPVYLQLLEHPDETLRLHAPVVLQVCDTHYAEIEPALQSRLSEETSPLVKASVLECQCYIWLMTAGTGQDQRFFTRPQEAVLQTLLEDQSQPALVKFVAALWLMQYARQPALHALRTRCVELLPHCEDIYGDSPWREGYSAFSDIGAALSRDPALTMQWFIEGARDPARRQSSLFSVQNLCARSRTAADRAAPLLVQFWMENTGNVRGEFGRVITCIGYAAIDYSDADRSAQATRASVRRLP